MKATGNFVNESSNQIISLTGTNLSYRRRARKNWSSIWRSILTFLAGSSDPQIEKIGEDNWRVYDPKSDRWLSFSSEQEVRSWLDQRYNF